MPGIDFSEGPVQLPEEELHKLRKVLRLGTGDKVAILPNDGSVWICELQGYSAKPESQEFPDTESQFKLTICQSLPKGDKLDEIVRSCTEIGVSHFCLFHSDRTVVDWDDKKMTARLDRLRSIAREACEVSFRTRIPTFEVVPDLKQVLSTYPASIVLAETENLDQHFSPTGASSEVVIGPEGGWSPKEVALIGDKARTLGPRVLRVDHAAAAAASICLLSSR